MLLLQKCFAEAAHNTSTPFFHFVLPYCTFNSIIMLARTILRKVFMEKKNQIEFPFIFEAYLIENLSVTQNYFTHHF